MKCLGMLLIVWGHSGGLTILDRASPFNYKQLGVAFFVFVMGYTLAQEARRPLRVLYNRLFEVYLFGGLFALVMSLIAWLTIRDLNESNYLPLMLGANVLFDHFPANPTTWYIGTYLHLLVFWMIACRSVRLRGWMIIAVVIVEVLTRVVLMQSVGDYIAYMLLTNWLGVFLLGQYAGQRALARASETQANARQPLRWLSPVALFALVGTWWFAGQSLTNLELRFPFRLVLLEDNITSLLVTSTCISVGYLLMTWLVSRSAAQLPHSRLAEFFARNTLIVFIVHMPLIYALAPLLYPLVSPGPLRILMNTVCFYVLPSLGSELIRRVVAPRHWRDVVLRRLQALAPRPA